MGGSDLVKISEQLGADGAQRSGSWASLCRAPPFACAHARCFAPLCALCGAASSAYDYVFAENGLVAFKAGDKLAEAVRACAALAQPCLRTRHDVRSD